jgi:hypothetical protein
MRPNPRSLLSAVLLIFVVSLAGLQAATTVITLVRVTAPNLGNHENMDIAIDPTDPNHLSAVSQPFNDSYSRIWDSFDGGATWSSTIEVVGSNTFDFQGSRPALAFNAAGDLFVTEDGPNGVGVIRRPAGLDNDHWPARGTIAFSASINYHPKIAVDRRATPNRVYVTASEGEDIRFARSTTNAQSFSRNVVNDTTDGVTAVGYPQVAVGPDGEVYVAWSAELVKAQLRVDRSDDGGVTWGDDRLVHTFTTATSTVVPFRMGTNPALFSGSTDAIASIDVDRSNGPHRGTVYVAYMDSTLSSSYDIFLRRSTDRGETWSEPLRVNDVGGSARQFMPRLTVDESDGSVHVLFYDTRNHTSGTPAFVKADLYHARSVDGGVSPPVNTRVTTSIGNLPFQNPTYIGVAARDNTVRGWFMFPDNATYNSQPIYFTTLDTPKADFTLTVEPPNQTSSSGLAVYAVDAVDPTEGFDDPIQLDIEGLPEGATASFSLNPMLTGGGSVLTVDTGTAAPGAYTLTVTGGTGIVEHDVTVSLTIAPELGLTLAPNALTVPRSGSAVIAATTATWNAPPADVVVTVAGLPAGATLQWTPSAQVPTPGTGSIAALVTVGNTTAFATYPLTFTATGGGLTRSVDVPLIVEAGAGVPTAIALTTNPAGMATYGESILITAEVPGATGTITFMDGGTILASGVALDATGRATITPPRLRAGTHAFSAQYVPDSGFLPSGSAIAFTVTQAPLTIAAADATRQYGHANPAFTGAIDGLLPGDVVTATYASLATATTPAGLQPIVPTAHDGNGVLANYAVALINGNLTIFRAPLTVTANPANRLYGDGDPLFTVSYTGLLNGDAPESLSLPLGFTTSAPPTAPAGGPYQITVSGPPTTANYDVGYAHGALTITPAVLLVKADNITAPYGSTSYDFTATISGYKNNETAETSGVSGAPLLTTTATPTTAAGQTRPITAAIGTLAAQNYTFTFSPGTLTVAKVVLTVTGNDKSRGYGVSNGTLASTITGFVNNQTLATSGVTGAASHSTTAVTASPVGTYPITPANGTLTAGNYSFTFVPGTLTVTKAVLTVTAANKTRAYGAANSFTAAITGFVLGQTLANSGVTGAAELSTIADAASLPGPYPIEIAIGTLAAPNYTFSLVAGTLTVSKAVLTVTPQAASRMYGGANPEFSATISGFVNGESLEMTDVAGVPSIATTATATSNAGVYNITATLGSLTASNYSFAFTPGQLTVTKAPLAVTANGKSRAYGASNGTLSSTITGFVNNQTLVTSGVTGTASHSTTAVSASAVGAYSITPAVGTLASSNYAFTFHQGTLTVTKAFLTVTAANKSRAYGAGNGTLSSTVTGFVLSQTLATSGVTGAAELSTTADTASLAGTTHPIDITLGTLAAANYDFTLVPGTLTVAKAVLTVTPQAATRLYGGTNPQFAATIAGFVNGETLETTDVAGAPGFTTTATATSNVGSYTITANVGSLTASNYSFGFSPGTLTVTKAPLTVTGNDKTRNYGATNGTLSSTITGFVNNQTLATSGVAGAAAQSTTALTTSPAGGYPITPALGTLASSNYSFTFVAGTLTVAKVTLTVTAANVTRAYGAANGALSATISGFVLSQTLATSGVTGAADVSTTADVGSAAGTYAITAAIGTLTATNYQFTFVDGTLTVTKAVLTVTVQPASRRYGDENPGFSYALTGFVNSETPGTSDVSGVAALATVATPFSNAGSHAITAGIGTLTSEHYAFAFVSGTLTVTKAPLIVTADDQSRVYGAGGLTFSSTITGFVNGQTLLTSGISGVPSYSTTTVPTSPVGTYPITPGLGALTSVNYSFTFVPGTLTITKASLTVTAQNKSRDYGAPNPTLTVTYAGFIPGQILANSGVTGSPALSTAATATTAPGAYPIESAIGTLASNNYEFAFAPGTLSIVKASLTVRADSTTKVYGAPVPTALTYTVTGFANGEQLMTSDVTGSPELSVAADETTPAGSREIQIDLGTLASDRYDFTPVPGTLTITKAPLGARVNPASREYGESNPEFSLTFTGFVRGETIADAGIDGAAVFSTPAAAIAPVGAHPLRAFEGTLTSPNYYFAAFFDGELTVTPALLTVNADHKEHIYGGPVLPLSATFSGFKNGETLLTSGVSGEPLLTSPVGAATIPGEYPIGIGIGSLDSRNYTYAFTPAAYIVHKATLTAKADNLARPAGQPNPALTVTFTGLVLGETFETAGFTGTYRLHTDADHMSLAGEYAITVAESTLSSTKYDLIAFDGGVLTVAGKMPTVIGANGNTLLEYGQPLGLDIALQPAVHGASKPVHVTFNGTTQVLTTGPTGLVSAVIDTTGVRPGGHVVDVRFDADDVLAASRYAVDIQIAKVTPSVSWSGPVVMEAGTALGAEQLNASSPVAGHFVYTPAAGAVLPLGSHPLTATFVPDDGGLYTEGTISNTVSVEDHTPPAIVAPPNQSVETDHAGGVSVSYPPAAITEHGSGIGPSGCEPVSGSVFPVGTTVVTCTATDGAGHAASATFSVTVTLVEPPPPPADDMPGMMHGSAGITVDATRHRVEFFARERASGAERGWLKLESDEKPNGRKDKRAGGDDHRFVSDSLSRVVFSDDPSSQPGRKPRPQVDTVVVEGTGRLNGKGGYTFEAHAVDRGEPGYRDEISVAIRDADGVVVLTVSGAIDTGNIQSNRLKGRAQVDRRN